MTDAENAETKSVLQEFAPLFTDTNEYWGAWNAIPHPDSMGVGALRLEDDGTVSLRLVTGGDWAELESSPGLIAGVHGETDDGRLLTLYDLRGGRAEGHISSYFTVSSIASKARLFDPSDTLLSRYRVRFTGLEKWLAYGYFRREGVDPHANDAWTMKVPVYDDSDRHEVAGHGFAVAFGGLLHPGHEPFVSMTWEQVAWVDLIADEPQTVRWYAERAMQLRDLMAVLAGSDFSETFAWGETTAEDGGVTAEYFHPRQLEARRRCDSGLPPAAFDYLDVKERFSDYCTRWFDDAEHLSAVHRLLVRNGGGAAASPVATFLSNVQALEALMRLTSDATVASEDEYQIAMETMLASLDSSTPRQLRDKIRGTLEYLNEPSLRQRVRELLSDLPESLRHLVTRNPKAFIDKVVSSRNALTHVGSETRAGLTSDIEYIAASELIRVALFSKLLLRLGADGELIAQRLGEDPWLSWMSTISPGSPPPENVAP